MNKLLVFLGFVFGIVFLPSCSHTPTIRVKNCKAIGANLYDCEVIPDDHYESRR